MIFSSRSIRPGDYLGDLDVRRRILLKWFSSKLDIELQIGLKLLRILSRCGIICV
jgi:hypothetical protein